MHFQNLFARPIIIFSSKVSKTAFAVFQQKMNSESITAFLSWEWKFRDIFAPQSERYM